MLEQIVEAFIVCAVIGGLAYLAGVGIAHVAEQRVIRALKGNGLDDRLKRLNFLSIRLKERRDQMVARMVRLDDQAKSVRRRHYMVQKRVTDMAISRSNLLRVVGEDEAFLRSDRPARRFVAHVVNRQVQRAQLEQKEHPTLARSWGRSQAVHVWAPSIGDAKFQVEKTFPIATGFFIAQIQEPEDEVEMNEAMDRADRATMTQS